MKSRSILFASLFLVIIFSTCSSRDEFYTVEIIDGVRTVHNIKPLWGDEPQVELEFVQQIGELDGMDENYQLFKPRDVAVDNENNIYILDAGNYRIQKYSPEGNYTATFGKQGQGPGELSSPSNLNIDINNTIYVLDSRNSRIQKYFDDGTNTETIKFTKSTNFLRIFSTGELVISEVGTPYDEFDDNKPILTILDIEGNIKRGVGNILEYENPSFGLIVNRTFGDVNSEDFTVLSFMFQNRIEKYSYSGSLVGVADRPLNFELPSDPEMFEMPASPGPPLRFPNYPLVSQNIGVDGRDRTWVITYKKVAYINPVPNNQSDPKVETFELHVFDPDLVFLGSVPLPATIKRANFRIFGERLFFIDGVNDMAVYEYKIVEK